MHLWEKRRSMINYIIQTYSVSQKNSAITRSNLQRFDRFSPLSNQNEIRERTFIAVFMTPKSDAHQHGLQSLQCSWTSSRELYADRPQTAGLVAEDIFLWSVGPKRSVNPPLNIALDIFLTYLITYILTD